MNTLKSTGEAWDQLEEKVDSLVKALIEQKNLPGMTVAVTKGGRLLLSKGYGYALVDGSRKLPMKPCSRSKIGSVTKAVITGPSGFQLMKLKNIDSKSQRLYGPKGFFSGIFDADIDIGIKTHAPKSAQWKEWYEKITIQHLLDHEAGFTRDTPDERDVAKMFGVSEDDVTPEQQHRYFLRTRELLYEPGNPPPQSVLNPYSNHGFGLWALLIKQMSGSPTPTLRWQPVMQYVKPVLPHTTERRYLMKKLLFTILVALAAIPAAAHDELYYSAAKCKPISAAHYQGSGAEGFEWNGIAGGWYNQDDDATQILVCPVPYLRNVNNLAPIVIRAVIDDRHLSKFASASLCRKGADASAPVCDSSDNFPATVGISTIELSVTPTSATRFVFMEVRIPDKENSNPFAGTGTSGFIGYRVFRD